MRIACVHIPQFALQCATRIDPSLRAAADGPALVVVGPAGLAHAADARTLLHAPSLKATAPIVLACSRAAWSLGARVGMTATQARSLSPQIEVVSADPQLERDTLRAVADVLLALSPVVDVGGRVGPGGAHLALYCEVPAKTRGTTFGDRLLERLEALGLTGRVGIADDRFTSWVAAWLGAWDAHDRAPAASPAAAAGTPARHDETGVVSVPRGGSAAFLAPRPLSLLSISPEVQHMLEALGVRTLGEFAALPSPTVSSRGARFEADYQALARGEGGNILRPYTPDAPIREEAVLRHIVHHAASSNADHHDDHHHDHQDQRHHHHHHHDRAHGLSAPAAVALLAERVAMRLAGRARCAARLDITIGGEAGERVVTVSPVRDGQGVLSTAEQLAEAIGAALGDTTTEQVWRLGVVVAGEALAGDGTLTDLEDAELAPMQRTFAIAAAPLAASAASAATTAVAGTAAAATAAAGTAAAGTAAATAAGTAATAAAAAATPATAAATTAAATAAATAAGTAATAAATAATAAAARSTRWSISSASSAPSAPSASSASPTAAASSARSASPSARSATSTRSSSSSSSSFASGPRAGAGTPAATDDASLAAAISDADVALSIALSTTGGPVDRVFGLTSPVSSAFASERRDPHRRTRRGKQRRRAEVASMV